MRLRRAELEDAIGISDLLADAFLEYARGLGRPWAGPYDWMNDRIAAGDLTLAETEAECDLEGLVVLSRDDEAGATTIDIVAVKPETQGTGVGRALMEFAEAQARQNGHQELRLYTVAKYDHLIRYYQDFGFTITHHGPRPKGDDGHQRAFMAKTLRGTEAEE